MHFLFIIIFALILIAIFVKLVIKATTCKCYCAKSLIGKTVIITGGNSGIGYETGLQLSGRGCKLIIADVQNGTKSVQNIIKETNNPNVYYKHVDLSSFASVRKFASDINRNEDRLDILINNAGIGYSNLKTTIDGLKPVLQINYLGGFLLTHLLIDLLKRTDESRIIFTASIMGHVNTLTKNFFEIVDRPLNVMQHYMEYSNTKALNIIAAKIFADKLKKYNVKVYSINPGMTYTNMHVNAFKTFAKFQLYLPINFMKYASMIYSQSLNESVQTTLHASLSKSLLNHSGKFIANCQLAYMPINLRNAKFCMEMWKISEKYANILENEKIK